MDSSEPSANPQDVLRKFTTLVAVNPDDSSDDEDFSKVDSQDLDGIGEDEDENDDKNIETSDETDDPTKPETVEKRKKRLRIKRLKKKAKARAYEFTGGTNVVGVIFLEIGRITDLPPERNSKPS